MAVVQERLVEVEADETVVSDRAPVGEEKAFRPYDPDQVLLMAPVLQEWIPDGDLAHLVSDLVESGTLDLSAIYDSYVEERGFPPYRGAVGTRLRICQGGCSWRSVRALRTYVLKGASTKWLPPSMVQGATWVWCGWGRGAWGVCIGGVVGAVARA
jgi:hypothetical protein